MASAKDRIVSIVEPVAKRRSVSLTSFSKSRLCDIGRRLDAKRITVDQAVQEIDEECEYLLERQDKKDIGKSLEKLR